jgi:hypothetical protein
MRFARDRLGTPHFRYGQMPVSGKGSLIALHHHGCHEPSQEFTISNIRKKKHAAQFSLKEDKLYGRSSAFWPALPADDLSR